LPEVLPRLGGKTRLGERFIRSWLARFNSTALCCHQASIERIRKFVKSERKLMIINKRQTTPDIRILGILSTARSNCPDFCMFFRREFRPVTKEAKYKFIRR
jgi:hypothetical protein